MRQKTLLLIGVALLTCDRLGAAGATQDGPRLVAHWKFDEGNGISTADASGSANHGTLMGGTQWVQGFEGQGLGFDGAKSYVVCGAAGMPAANAPQSIALWFNVSEIPKNVQQFAHLQVPNGGSGVYLGLRDSKVGAWRAGGWGLANANAPIVNEWHHVAYTYDGTTHQIYIDGILSGSSTNASDKGQPSSVELGRYDQGNTKEYFRGYLDEVRIYAGALTAGDLKGIIPAEKLAKGPSGGAVLPPPPGAPEAGAARGPVRPLPPDPKAQEREKKAQEALDAALSLEKDGKFVEAQAKLRELRSRYRGTWVYSDHWIEISDRITGLGLKVAVAALGKTGLYKRPHQDSWYGFEFAPPDGWKGVPPAAAWFNDYDNSEVDYKGETIRVGRYTAPYLDRLNLQVLKVYSCSGLDFLEQKVTSYLDQHYKKLKEEGKSQLQGKASYLRKLYSTDGGDRLVIYYYFGERRGLALVGAWRAGSEEMGYYRITTTVNGKTTIQQPKTPAITQEDFGYALKVFDASAKTFWILDPGTRSGLSIKLEKGALCSDWQLMRSSKGNYLIEYATSAEYAKKCGEELEQIQGLYRQVIPSAKGIPQCRVKVFDREEDFQYYGLSPGAAAYWSPGQEEVVCYKFEGDKVTLDSREEFTIAEERPVEETTFKILYHEAFHQYMFYMMGRGRRIYVPSWLNEGLGDYFFGGEWAKNRSKFTIGINDWRVKTIVNAVKKNEHVGLDKIFRYDQMQYYANAHLCYAEGWAINYFFMQSPVAKAKAYHQIPLKMLEALKTGAGGPDGWQKATDKAFGGIDLQKMEEEWKAFVLTLPIPKSQMDKDDENNK
ncbi:MAG TPA: LamG-like jellyroll fold domain-containing protein [Planctomycetota bacterium]|nr:LamG-like jellyroll fold domain-containing protein [Planctomycetota bacterium]